MLKPLELAVGAVVAIAIAATIADTASGETAPAEGRGLTVQLSQVRPAPPPMSAVGRRASIEMSCGAVTYKLSTGSGKGTCAAGVALAECADGAGNAVRLHCDSGCGSTSGAAWCAVL